MFYIYTLKCPVTKQVRYVGKTKNPNHRERAHYQDSHVDGNVEKYLWIKNLLRKDLQPIFEIVAEVPTPNKARRREIAMIKYYARIYPLFNRNNNPYYEKFS